MFIDFSRKIRETNQIPHISIYRSMHILVKFLICTLHGFMCANELGVILYGVETCYDITPGKNGREFCTFSTILDLFLIYLIDIFYPSGVFSILFHYNCTHLPDIQWFTFFVIIVILTTYNFVVHYIMTFCQLNYTPKLHLFHQSQVLSTYPLFPFSKLGVYAQLWIYFVWTYF